MLNFIKMLFSVIVCEYSFLKYETTERTLRLVVARFQHKKKTRHVVTKTDACEPSL